MQDVPDQKQIVAQYCRYTGEIKTGKNVKQMVHRALQFATSAPQGPVYLMGAREVMEEVIEPYSLNPAVWRPMGPSALPPGAVDEIASSLIAAERPLVITGYSGRNPRAVPALAALADTVKGLRVLDMGGCDMCFPADHPASLGFKYGVHDDVRTADLILIIDCDVPWINTLCKPNPNAKIYHLDVDPLKQTMLVFYVDAQQRFRVDSETALTQINNFLRTDSASVQRLADSVFGQRWEALKAAHAKRLGELEAEAQLAADGKLNTAYVCRELRKNLPEDTIFAVEAVTNSIIVSDHVRPTIPGQWINCGGGGLGWSGGGALGIKLAADAADKANGRKPRFVVQIVGDGSFLFSVPSSVYWISMRYKIPILTIVLNNKGMLSNYAPIRRISLTLSGRMECASEIYAPGSS